MTDLGNVAWPPAPIRTERLVLREPEARDRAAFIELLASPEVHTYLSGPRPRDELGDDDVPVEPIERYLAHLTDVDRSPNTVRAYAYDLKDYWTFLAHRGLDWREVRLEDPGEYVVWLQLPPSGRKGQGAVLPSVEPHVSAATVN